MDSVLDNPDSMLHRSAVALNNAGVSLLQRQCYAQAAEAFERAAVLMPGSLFHSSEGVLDCHHHPIAAEDLVRHSLQQLTSAKPARQETLIMEVLSISQQGYLMLERGSQQDDRTVLESILLDAPSLDVGHPVRFDSHPTLHQGAIITHNLAIACLCLARTIATTNEGRIQMKSELLEKVVEYSKASSTILLKKWRASMRLARELANRSQGHSEDCQDAVDLIPNDLMPTSTNHIESAVSNLSMNQGVLDGVTIAMLNTYLSALQESRRTQEARILYRLMVDFRASALDNEEQKCQTILRTILTTGGFAAAA